MNLKQSNAASLARESIREQNATPIIERGEETGEEKRKRKGQRKLRKKRNRSWRTEQIGAGF